MPYCAACGSRQQLPRATCPDCGHVSAAEHLAAPHDDLVSVARFRNGAEAGYFADELQQREFHCEVQVRDAFDSRHGTWSFEYALLVPRDQGQQALEALQKRVDETGDRELPGQTPETPETLGAGSLAWGALLVALAAGSLAWYTLQRDANRPGFRNPRPPGGHDLWNALATSPEPWLQHDPQGSTRRLQFDPASRTARLEEDQNADGRFETVAEFTW